jgi:hypothetical protein
MKVYYPGPAVVPPEGLKDTYQMTFGVALKVGENDVDDEIGATLVESGLVRSTPGTSDAAGPSDDERSWSDELNDQDQKEE